MSDEANFTTSEKKLVNALPKLKKRKFKSPTDKQILGQAGENLAQQYLIRKGYQIFATNFYCKSGEIDLIAMDKDEIVFVEVKTRNTDYFGHPSSAVTKEKLHRMSKTAQRFLIKTGKQNFYRFDIISILPNKIEHFENVTME